MKRPLLKACLVYLGTLILSILIPSSYTTTTAAAITIMAVAALLFIVSIFKRSALKIAVLSLVSLLTIASFMIYNKVTIEPAKKLYGTDTKITGTVMTDSNHGVSNRSYVVKLSTINGEKAPRDTRILLYCDGYDALSDYDEISAEISFFEAEMISENESYYLSDSVVASAMTTGDVIITNKDDFSLLREICRFRDKIIFNIRVSIPDEHGDIISGILFGKRNNISNDTRDLFATAGISHLLTVSGLHLTIIVFLLNTLLLLFGIRKIPRTIISLLFTVLMMIMTGFTPSIVRASIMTSMALIGSTLRRDYDSMTAMCLSAVVICFASPYAITNVGFLLSFSATTGLIISQKILEKQRRKFSMKTVSIPRLIAFELLKLILPCFMAFIFTIPISTYVFGYIATYSPVSNFLLAPIIPLLLGFSLLGALLSLTGISFIYEPLLYVARILVSCVVWVAEKISLLPYSKIYLPEDFILIIAIFAFLAFGIAILSKRPYRNSVAAALLCVPIICISVLAQNYIDKDSIKISVIDSSVPCSVIEYGNRYFISGFSSDGSYDISKTASHPAKKIALLSAPSLKNTDVSKFTQFITSNNISCISLPKEQSAAIVPLGESTLNKTFTSENFYLEFGKVSVTSKIYGKNTSVLYNIDGYKIAQIYIAHPDSIPDSLECDILIANASVVPFIDKYKCKYFILSQELEDSKYLSKSLKNKGILYLGDSGTEAIYLRGKELYKKW